MGLDIGKTRVLTSGVEIGKSPIGQENADRGRKRGSGEVEVRSGITFPASSGGKGGKSSG